MSHSTYWLNRSGSDVDGTVSLPAAAHAWHSRQFRIRSGNSSKTDPGTPAACKRLRMEVTFACHHLKCSLRSSRRMTAQFGLLSALSEFLMSNLAQSLAVAVPASASLNTLLARSTVSGPLPTGCGAGGGGGSDPEAELLAGAPPETPVGSDDDWFSGICPCCRSEAGTPV